MTSRQRRRAVLETADGRPPLLDVSQQDRALRDLMPVVEWLTAADQPDHNDEAIADCLLRALRVFRRVRHDSPAVDAYIRWLEQNTELGIEPGTTENALIPETILRDRLK